MSTGKLDARITEVTFLMTFRRFNRRSSTKRAAGSTKSCSTTRYSPRPSAKQTGPQQQWGGALASSRRVSVRKSCQMERAPPNSSSPSRVQSKMVSRGTRRRLARLDPRQPTSALHAFQYYYTDTEWQWWDSLSGPDSRCESYEFPLEVPLARPEPTPAAAPEWWLTNMYT